jgi:replicative DNA helicase
MQLQPHSNEAERLVLGQVLTDNSIIDQIAHYIPDESVFYQNKHKQIWKAMISMHRNGATTIDAVTITANIPPNEYNKSPGYYITGLLDEVVTTSTAEQYAKVIYEKWLLRKVIEKSRKIEDVMSVDGSDAYKVLQRLHRELEDILNLRVREDYSLKSLLDSTVENMFSTKNLIPYGNEKLDKMTGGMTRGEITVIAGRPGHFKSTMMINVVSKLLSAGKKVLVLNREMSNVEMMKKLIVLESDTLMYDRIRMGRFDDDEREELNRVTNIIKNRYSKLIMYDDIFDIDRAMREIRKHKPDVVVDDYIGLVDVLGIDDNRLRIDNIMKQYKRAAKTYNMSALLVSQLNRGCEDRANKRPILRDLRDSGSIEQDAETILFMYYDYRYNMKDSSVGEYGIEVVLGKNRYGRTGNVMLGVIGNRCKILESPDDAMSEISNNKD